MSKKSIDKRENRTWGTTETGFKPNLLHEHQGSMYLKRNQKATSTTRPALFIIIS